MEIECSQPPTQFDGIYKIAQVFGSVLELNKPPSQFPLLENMTIFLGIMLVQQLESEMLVMPLINQSSTAAPSS